MIFTFSPSLMQAAREMKNHGVSNLLEWLFKVICGRDSGRTCLLLRNTCWEICFPHGLQRALTIFLPVTKEEGVGEGSSVSIDHHCGAQQRTKT